ncbi:MAG: hypothetical protein Q8P95_01785, partial [bacterium]|nr:hypothetical protein [bacterium]
MADPNTIKGQPEGAPEVHSPEKVSTPSLEPRQVSGSREGIAQTLMPGEAGAESGADSIESG